MRMSYSILFDFDATLVDSITATHQATNAALEASGFAPVTASDVVAAMRFDSEGAFAHHTGVTSRPVLAALTRDYFRTLTTFALAVEPFLDVFDLVRSVKNDGAVTGIVSSNSASFVQSVLGRLGMTELFDAMIGDGDAEGKPSPDGILSVLNRFDVPAWRAAYVGDSASDAEAARRAGVFAVGVRWAQDRHGLPAAEGFPRMARTPGQLLTILDGWIDLVKHAPSELSAPKRLFIMRHCESEANAHDLLASQLDFELSDRGRADAHAIAAAFGSQFAPDAVMSSPLLRARQTAEAVAARSGVPVTTCPQIIEQDLGVFAGLSYAEIGRRSDYEHDRTKRWHWVPDGGESYCDIYARVCRFFLSTVLTSPHRSILIVTHAVTMRLIRAFLENTAPAYPSPIAGNGEIWDATFQAPGSACAIRELQLLSDPRGPARA